MDQRTIDAIAADLAQSFGAGPLPSRFTEQYPGFDIDDGYAIAHRLRAVRQARGETPVGRKIGATNRAMWPILGVSGPGWNFMYDTTVNDLTHIGGAFALGRFAQPRIEPEIVLHLAAAPKAGMSEAALLGCVDRVSHAYELVHSPFSNWTVSASDAAAAYGLHMALLLGPWHDISAHRSDWEPMLKDFAVTLSGSDGTERHGTGRSVLDGPILALKFLVDALADHPEWAPLLAGEIITTGTLTEAMPVRAGQTWTTTITGAPLEGLRVRLS